MLRKTMLLSTSILIALLAALLLPPPAFAIPDLVEANPVPDAVLETSPDRVTLVFDRALGERDTWIAITNEDGQRVDNQDGTIDSTNRHILSVSLPLLPEGRYRVTYSATSPGDSVVSSGSYLFTVDYPAPQLILISPLNGQAFTETPIPLTFEGQYINFEQGDTWINLFVDGELIAQFKSMEYAIEELSPGVHEIVTMLVQNGGIEQEQTRSKITLAIAHPDVELEGRESAAAAPPDPGLQLTTTQWVIVFAIAIALLGTGIVLGIKPRQAKS